MHIHPDITEREKLLCSLFNMKKKPNKKERALIIGGNHKHIPIILHNVISGTLILLFIIIQGYLGS